MNPKKPNSIFQISRLILRRDRIRLIIWTLSIPLMLMLSAVAYDNMYPSPQERVNIISALDSPAMVSLMGPAYGVDNPTIGVMTAAQTILFAAVAVAIMNILYMSRHTRKSEESGRLELVRALPVGRHDSLLAAYVVSILMNLFMGLFTALFMILPQIEGVPIWGSLTFGMSLTAIGLAFSGLTAFFAQITETSSGTTGFSFTALGIAFLLRAIGDIENPAISMLSPLGWITRVEPYYTNAYWPIAVSILTFIVFSAIAVFLNAKRDMGAGYIPQRSGRKETTLFIRNPIGLVIRLTRVTITSWLIGLVVLGASYGAAYGEIEVFFTGNEMFELMLSMSSGTHPIDQYTSMLMVIMSIASAIPGILMILRLRVEEKHSRIDHLLTSTVSRKTAFAAFYLPALLMGTLSLISSILGMWGAAYMTLDNPLSLSKTMQAGLVYLPAIWIMIALAATLIAFIPRWTSLIWGYLSISFFLIYFGGLMQLPDWTFKLSPFGFIPQLPEDDINYVTLLLMVITGIALSVIAFIQYRRRDLLPN